MGNCLAAEQQVQETSPAGGGNKAAAAAAPTTTATTAKTATTKAKDKGSLHKSSSRDTTGSSLHSNLLRHQTKNDVFKKYDTVKVLGNGSMGFVAKVQIKPDAIGGSAVTKTKTVFGGVKAHPEEIKERRDVPVNYALKSIILDRVSPLFLNELRNEIDILKGMVSCSVALLHCIVLWIALDHIGPRVAMVVLQIKWRRMLLLYGIKGTYLEC
mmetsp:Transcript_5244/g.14145  ORF Transcript_5244/g.14145 Transcript_5244/m.14145 type:complete len:213 (-) Transcript_5244:1590-2228(-)